MTQKICADANGPSYTYTETGKLHTRTWARGKNTTYTYGDLGQIINVNYSDSTPAITYTHDRLGRITSSSSSASTSTFHYDGLALDYETQNGWIIKRKQDVFGRDIGYELYNSDDSVNPVKKIIYGYDIFNRLNTITSIIGTETNTFTYTYLQGTDLVSGMSSDSGMQWSRHYEPERDLIIAVTNSWYATTTSAFDYINDPLGRRTRRADYYSGSTLINDFDYNIRGEVISVIMGNDNHSYSNDPIGNRKQSTVYSGQSTVTNVYTANQLNQYTSASFAGSARNLSHDLDGNLTWDGIHWAHSWDGENRLTSSAPNYWGTTNGATRIDYTYDYMNRRASRTTSMMAGRSISYPPSPTDPQGSWSALEICRYIWDGWNIVAEIIIDQTEFTTNVNYYAWGLDLSGTLQGAGGVGGLLAETKTAESGTNTYYALGGANGNVTEYIDNTGAVKAHYEYNAFGEITAQSGVMADDFAFRFSTKCYDPETGLYYYGHRYYDPIFGRWLSVDPIGIKGGINLYLLSKNDAINKWDYLGMASMSWEEYGRMKHFGQLKEQLKRQLKALCPKSPTSWKNDIWKKDQCCKPKTCNEEAERMAEAYINNLQHAYRVRKYPGGGLGNWCIYLASGLELEAGNGYEDIDDTGLTCGGWTDMGQRVLDPITDKSECWIRNIEKSWFSIDLSFWSSSSHMWISLQIMNGSKIHLDPYPSGGKIY
ncbi:MAG: RHS repeat-associated core domain-containing protein [Candidatus Cloacimonetes bacterium]|nr:RHS repeat-associated core domain-containing protein [Candidatus Cloacimonadota bacterium]